MDIEKLIEQLRWWADHCDRTNYGCHAKPFLLDAAAALSALQTENERLRDELKRKVNLVFQQAKELDRRNLFLQEQEAELDDLRAQWDMYGGDVGITAVYKELEQVKREKDAAASDLESVMAYRGDNLDTCQFCKNGQCYVRGGTKQCLPQWRGQKEE